MNKDNYFQSSPGSPFHLSVGALVFNKESKILVHRFNSGLADNPFPRDIYTLIRETMEPGETIEAALARGIKEEAGSEAELVAFLGSLTGLVRDIADKTKSFNKTTVYFAMKLIDWQPDQRLQDDREAASELQWREPEEMIPIMQEQGEMTGSADLDESVIIERFLDLLKESFSR